MIISINFSRLPDKFLIYTYAIIDYNYSGSLGDLLNLFQAKHRYCIYELSETSFGHIYIMSDPAAPESVPLLVSVSWLKDNLNTPGVKYVTAS